MGLRNLHRSSVLPSRSGGRRECKQLSLERIFLKKDLLKLRCNFSSISTFAHNDLVPAAIEYFVGFRNWRLSS